MTATLVLSNSSLASHSSYRSLTEDDQRRVRDKRTEREARSLALEKAYVHDVYEQISGNFTDSRYRPWPRVKQFLMDLEPGSFVCDVGCGSGKYLSVNPLLFNIGVDRCKNLTEIAREKDNEVLICDNMALPYKDDSFDAVLSIAVIHHIATTERRVRALRELARILRVGGRIIISVWSMEQRHRRFESQDVLIPWHRPAPASSADEVTIGGPGDRDTTTTTCTSEEDVTHYHAYTQTGTSDSEQGGSGSRLHTKQLYRYFSRISQRRRGRSRHKGRSFSPGPGFPSSSDLSSPNETCYSFVRKAIQKIATNKRQPANSKLPWFFNNLESYYAKEMEAWQLARMQKNDSAESNENGEDLPIEIRHLEDSDDMILIPPLLSILGHNPDLDEALLCKSKSLNDLTKLSPSPRERRKIRDQGRSNTCDDPTVPCVNNLRNSGTDPRSNVLREPRSKDKDKTEFAASSQSVQSAECSGGGWMSGSWRESHHLGSLTSLSSAKSAISALSIKSDSGIGGQSSGLSKLSKLDFATRRSWCSESQLEKKEASKEPPTASSDKALGGAAATKSSKTRSLGSLFKPLTQSLDKEKVKLMTGTGEVIKPMQMGSIKEVNESDVSEANSPAPSPSMAAEAARARMKDQRPALVKQKQSIQAFNFPDSHAIAQHHFKELGRELSERGDGPFGKQPVTKSSNQANIEIEVTEITVLDESSERQKSIKKQASLNDEIFYAERQKEREAIKEKLRRQRSLPEGNFSSEEEEKPKTFKDSILAVTNTKKFDILRESITKLRHREESKATETSETAGCGNQSSSLKVGISKMLNRWKSESADDKKENFGGMKSFTQKRGVNIDPINVFGGLRRDQSLDSATRRGLFHRKGAWSPKSPKQLENTNCEGGLLSPTLRRCCLEAPEDGGHHDGGQRRPSGSDSSKDSSIQSDTSLDSEDSCISVIFVPRPGQDMARVPADSTRLSSGSDKSQRSTSNSSGSSDSPTGRGSPASPGTVASSVTAPAPASAEEAGTGTSEVTTTETNQSETIPGSGNCPPERRLSSSSAAKVTLPEHKSFEMEDIPDENPINCHPRSRAFATTRVDSNKLDYPIVRHHPLFAKTRGSRTISSLLVGENVEYMRKPGDLSKSVQSVRKSSPKLLTFEIFNPETDDLDSDSSLSCSSDSAESVISVISDARNSEPARGDSEERPEVESKQDNLTEPEPEKISDTAVDDEDLIFQFDVNEVAESSGVSEQCHNVERKASPESRDGNLMDLKSLLEIEEKEREIERKSEARKRILMILLDENKSVLQNMKACNSDAIEEVSWKTTSQLKSMEELRIPSFSRSPSSSPERQECKSEPISSPVDSVQSLDNEETNNKSTNRRKVSPEKSRISSAQKLKQISGKISEDSVTGDLENTAKVNIAKTPASIAIRVTEHGGVTTVNEGGENQERQAEAKAEAHENTSDAGDTQGGKKRKDFHKGKKVSEESVQEKSTESLMKPETESPGTIPLRKLERKKRDDSLESNTASVKSSVQLSDTGSLLSHRFSTISISSNVSSDVSFGNASAVSGSSCYLASMSSADFDDRPPLASSFSLSEAEEAEHLVPATPQTSPVDPPAVEDPGTIVSDIKKKDQLSPPKPSTGKNSDRPKLRSLFKRSSNSNKSNSSNEKSKSLHSSNESRSHDGKDEGVKIMASRSRIGTFSTLTPDTSQEAATCVERLGGSTSFEEELFRSRDMNCEQTGNGNQDQGHVAYSEESDSETEAETGGSLTHHRYYHVFREGEIDHIIEKYVENLHIISSYYDHANWCIIAEKVNVWTI